MNLILNSRLLILLIFCLRPVLAQDTSQVLTLAEVYEQLNLHHPIVRQAKLLNEMARQELRLARGGFDPKLVFSYDRKQFDKKEYYDQINGKLKVPLWVGEISAGYERNSGVFLNPESTTDAAGLAALGVEVPIGRGLLIDERRSTLKQARFFQDIADAEKIKEINKVYFTAAKSYWEWYFDHQRYQLIKEGYELARIRLEGIKMNIRLGELAAIDSVYGRIAMQERDIALRQAEIALRNARLELSNHLWGENDTPLELKEGVVPQDFNQFQIFVTEAQKDELLNNALENHPEIRKQRAKLSQLSIEERLQSNNLLPKAKLKYNIIRNVESDSETTNFNFENNYKLGVDFEFPLFLRKERGKLQQVRIKQNQENFKLTQTRREIENGINQAYNDLKNLEELIDLQQAMVLNYTRLRDAELRKFSFGESSLFLINAVEAQLIEGQIKLESQKSKYEKARAELLYEAGVTLWE